MTSMERVKITPGSQAFFFLFLLLLAVSYYSRYLLLTTLVGIGIGTLMAPLLTSFRKRFHMPRALTALIMFLLILAGLGGVLFSIYFLVADQMNALTAKAPDIMAKMQGWFTHVTDKHPWLQEQVNQLEPGNVLRQSAFNVLKGLQVGIVGLSGAAFALIIGLYTAVSASEYFEDTVEAFAPRYRQKASGVLTSCSEVLRGWFKAQLIDMVIIGVVTGLGLWAFGIEYWAIFGLLTGVLGLIPYVGIILVVTAATLITLASDPSKVVWVLLVFGITQQLEGNVILPLVMKDRIQLPVVPLLVFMLLMGSFFGILGVFIAPPLFAVLKTLYQSLYLPYIENANQPSAHSSHPP